MERRQQMDTAGFASTRRQMKAATIFLILAFSAFPLLAQPALSDRATEIKQLFAEERWEEIVRVVEADAERPADTNYYYGTALARLGRLDEAKRAFQTGISQQPADKRFSLEAAGRRCSLV